MTAAPFILCASWCAASAGALLPPPGRAELSLGGGVATVLPTVGAGVTVGATSWLAVSARWDSYAALANVAGVAARARVAPGWAVGLGAGYGLYFVDEIFGVQTAHSPFARGAYLEPALHLSRWSGSVHLGFSVGATVRLAAGAPLSAQAEVTADWPSGLYLRFQALVPLEGDLRVLGYLPAVTVGRTFAF